MSEYIGEVNDQNFEGEVLKSSQPVLVDFWAEWCGPCRQLAPGLEAVAERYQGTAKIVKLNIDDSPLTPQRYGVRGIPTLILFKDGAEQQRIIGYTAKDNIPRAIHKHVGQPAVAHHPNRNIAACLLCVS